MILSAGAATGCFCISTTIGSDSISAEAKEASTESAIKMDGVDEYIILILYLDRIVLESRGFYFMRRMKIVVSVSTFPVICVVLMVLWKNRE